MLLHLGIELFSNVKKFPLLYKEKLRQLGERKYIGFNSITLIELHIHFELRISDYAVIQKYLECCNPNFRAENFRFPNYTTFCSSKTLISTLLSLRDTINSQDTVQKFCSGFNSIYFPKFYVSYVLQYKFSNNKFKEKCSKIM